MHDATRQYYDTHAEQLFDGFETGRLNNLNEQDWIAGPPLSNILDCPTRLDGI